MAYRCFFTVAILLLMINPLSSNSASANERLRGNTYLAGTFLVATKSMQSSVFEKSVVLMVEHNADGAFGLIINRLFGRGPLKELVEGFGLDATGVSGEIDMHFGGPVDLNQAFIVHGARYQNTKSNAVMDGIYINNHRSVVRDISLGKGPEDWLLVLGYSGWAAGQLEQELARGDWVSAPVDAKQLFSGGNLKSLWIEVLPGAGLPL